MELSGVVYRVPSEGAPNGTTAEDLVDYEAEVLGNKDVKRQAETVKVDLAEVDGNRLKWVTRKRSKAERYGPNVREIRLSEPVKVVAQDHEGGYLVVLPDPIDW